MPVLMKIFSLVTVSRLKSGTILTAGTWRVSSASDRGFNHGMEIRTCAYIARRGKLSMLRRWLRFHPPQLKVGAAAISSLMRRGCGRRFSFERSSVILEREAYIGGGYMTNAVLGRSSGELSHISVSLFFFSAGFVFSQGFLRAS